MGIKQRNVLTLFSSPVYVSTIEENLDHVFESIKNLNYIPANNYGTYMSETVDVLSKFPSLNNALLDEFNYYKNSYLYYEDTEFFMTTSWITKSIPNSTSHKHNHLNSLYSGVLYFQGGKDFADIRLFNDGIIPQQIELKDPTQWNTFNSSSWDISSIPNRVIIFPSYLYHEVSFHGANEDRYSLAFNLFPKGNLGKFDSSLDIKQTLNG
tara:strand:+ start:385 stop:1014 length:630 start_codon:yes stop_codon:yes gene_type:complete